VSTLLLQQTPERIEGLLFSVKFYLQISDFWSGAEGIRTPDLRRAKAERRFRGHSPSFEKPLKKPDT
jgi:hypothetical protein